MHTRHFVLIKYDPAESVEWQVENSFPDGADYWWDWFTVGGRWDGELGRMVHKALFPNTLENANVLRLTPDHLKAAAVVLDDIKASWNDEVRRYHKQLLAADSKALHSKLQEVLDSNIDPTTLTLDGLALWPFYRLLDMLERNWNPSLHYFDLVSHNSDWGPLEAAIQNKTSYSQYGDTYDLSDLALVAVDFHF